MRRGAWVIVLMMALGCSGCAAGTRGGMGAEEMPAETAAPGPLTGYTILVDAGHGGYDGGARCVDSGVWEKKLNLEIALMTEQALKARGAAVVMTRRSDLALCDEKPPAGKTLKRQDMERRVAMAVEQQADMVLSIHMNEYRSRSESGPQVFYRGQSSAGRLLAGCMQEALIDALQPHRKRSAMAGDYFILQLEVPSVLIECGFISNAAEEKLLLSQAYQAQLAEAIAEGVVDYRQVAGVLP